MALFEDRRKPVDIYKQGTATANAQGNMNALASRAANAVTAPARTAANVGILAPAKRLMTDVVTPAAQAVARPIMQGRENQNRFMAGQELNRNITPARERQAIGAIAGPNFERKIGAVGQRFEGATPIPRAIATASNPRGKVSNMGDPSVAERGTAAAATLPQPLALPQQAPPPQSTGALNQLLEPQTKTVYTNQGGKIISQQQPIGPSNPAPSLGEPTPPVNALSRRAGNLDIQFEPGTDPAAIQRFMENPIRPTAQIDRFNNMRFGPFQESTSSQARERVPPPSFQNSGPSRTWGQAKASDDKAIANAAARRDYYQGIENSQKNRELDINQTQVGNQFATARMNDATNREQNAINRFNYEATARNNAEKNRIDAETLAAGQPVREAQSKYYGAQAEDLPARRSIDEKRVSVQDEQNRIAEEKIRLQDDKAAVESINKIEDTDERLRAKISAYDPQGPPSQMKSLGKAATREMGMMIDKDFVDNSGKFDAITGNNPAQDIYTKYFPENLNPYVAREILDNIGNAELKQTLGKMLKKRYSTQ